MIAPLCARCGCQLQGTGHIVVSVLDLPLRPTAGWCANCSARDILADRQHIAHLGWASVLLHIAARGPGRVVPGDVQPPRSIPSPCPN